MNFFNFILTRQLVLNKTDDQDRANKLALMTSFMPGPWGMMMGVLLADREEKPPVKTETGTNGQTATGTELLPAGSTPPPAAKRA